MFRRKLASPSSGWQNQWTRNNASCKLATDVVPSSSILVTMIMEAQSSSETSILTKATWHNIPEDAILHNKQLPPETIRKKVNPMTPAQFKFDRQMCDPQRLREAESKFLWRANFWKTRVIAGSVLKHSFASDYLLQCQETETRYLLGGSILMLITLRCCLWQPVMANSVREVHVGTSFTTRFWTQFKFWGHRMRHGNRQLTGHSHVLPTIGSQMEMRLSALSTGRPLQPLATFLVLISVRDWVNLWDNSLDGRARLIKKSGTRTRDLPACRIASLSLRNHQIWGRVV
jgi:hypothetical protein